MPIWRRSRFVAGVSSRRIGPARVFYGWWIVAVSLLIDACKHGTFNRGISFYVLPLSTELGVGVAKISFADVLGRLTGGLAGPVVGYLTDRLGPRTMLVFGGVVSGLGFILMSFTSSYRIFLLVFVGLISFGFRTGYNNAASAALNQWFRRRRALAMSVSSIGTGLGGVGIAPLVGLLVLKLGWRTAAQISGITILAIVIPLSLLVRRSRKAWACCQTETGLTGPFPTRLVQEPELPAQGRSRQSVIETLLGRPVLRLGHIVTRSSPPERQCGHRPIGCWYWRWACATRYIRGFPFC